MKRNHLTTHANDELASQLMVVRFNIVSNPLKVSP